MSSYLKRPSRTQVLKLAQIVPVELRYETIVVEDGRVRIYRDVYGQKTNTEENLRAVLDAHGISFDGMSESEKSQVLEILNIVSRNPKRQPTPAPTVMPTQTVEEKRAAAAARKSRSRTTSEAAKSKGICNRHRLTDRQRLSRCNESQ